MGSRLVYAQHNPVPGCRRERRKPPSPRIVSSGANAAAPLPTTPMRRAISAMTGWPIWSRPEARDRAARSPAPRAGPRAGSRRRGRRSYRSAPPGRCPRLQATMAHSASSSGVVGATYDRTRPPLPRGRASNATLPLRFSGTVAITCHSPEIVDRESLPARPCRTAPRSRLTALVGRDKPGDQPASARPRPWPAPGRGQSRRAR